MAIFSKKTAKKKEVVADKKVVENHPLAHKVYDALKSPRITEKATFSAEKGVYVFNVSVDATKHAIAKAIMQTYKVTPKRIAVINMKGKEKLVRGKWGKTASYRKAYVYLKTGDKIEII